MLGYLSKKFGQLLDGLPRGFITDLVWAHWQYWITFHAVLNLVKPRKFSEKMQWLKFFDRKNISPALADKYLIREYVEKKVDADILIPLVGVYDSVEEINFDRFPESFVLKATHGSGYCIVCPDKKNIDQWTVRQEMGDWLKTNYYHITREWVYKKIKPRIICEQFITDENGKPAMDYKFFCFNGEPVYIMVSSDRFTRHAIDIYNLRWEWQNFRFREYPSSGKDIPKPKNFAAMSEIAKILAHGLKFIRVDLYSVGEKVFFGELTYYPANGFGKFYPKEYDLILGELLVL